MLSITRMISKFNNSSRHNRKIKFIVLHYTANKGDTAKNNADYFGGGDRQASAHYFVSDKQIYQVVEDFRAAWSVANGGNGAYNYNTLNIEMCCDLDGNVSTITEKNTIDLVKFLMKKYDIALPYVIRHFDVTGKNCPNWSLNRWNTFKSKLVDKVISKGECEVYDICKNNPIKKGSKGLYVSVVQSMLSVLGRYSGSIDGNAGPLTESAIVKYNNDYGLANGNSSSFGPKCWYHIFHN